MESAYIGNAAAAVEISMLGNHPVEADRVRERLRRHRAPGPSLLAEQTAPIEQPAHGRFGATHGQRVEAG